MHRRGLSERRCAALAADGLAAARSVHTGGVERAIVFVTGWNPARGKGGGSSYVRTHMRAARRAGYEPHAFCIDQDNGTTEEAFGTVHRVVPALPFRRALAVTAAGGWQSFLGHWFSSFALSPYNHGAHAPRLAAAVERFLARRPGPHLIHGFYTWSGAGLDVRKRLQARGIDCVVVSSIYTTARHEAAGKAQGAAHAPALQRALFSAERIWIDRVVRRRERRVYRESDLVLVNYDSVRRLLLAEHGARAAIRKIPYCPDRAFDDESVLADGERTAGDPLIVSVSRHDPRKGIDILLRALAALRAGGARFRACVVSGGPLLAAHRLLAEKLGLAETAEFTGWVADSAPYFRRADIFVLPSIEEGSGSLSLLEAMQAGAAIVASHVDGIPEDVADGESALLVEPGNVEALRAALARLVDSAALRHDLGRRARAAFVERFSADAFAAALGRVYAEAASGS